MENDRKAWCRVYLDILKMSAGKWRSRKAGKEIKKGCLKKAAFFYLTRKRKQED
jgi:hypothetical protein